jgi:hypothetical protein
MLFGVVAGAISRIPQTVSHPNCALFLFKWPVIIVTTPGLVPGYDGQPYGPSTHETAFPSRTRRYLGPTFLWRWSMIVPVMWSVWAVLVVALAALYIYRSRLTRDEDDQIYLDDAFNHEKQAQAEIVAKVNKVEPMVKITSWLAAASTVFVIGFYVLDFAKKLGVL